LAHGPALPIRTTEETVRRAPLGPGRR
jgi:hypothetical protein